MVHSSGTCWQTPLPLLLLWQMQRVRSTPTCQIQPLGTMLGFMSDLFSRLGPNLEALGAPLYSKHP